MRFLFASEGGPSKVLAELKVKDVLVSYWYISKGNKLKTLLDLYKEEKT